MERDQKIEMWAILGTNFAIAALVIGWMRLIEERRSQ